MEPAVVPSLLVFGPQAKLPSQEILAGMRQELISNSQLSPLYSAAKSLPQFWRDLVSFDSSLSHIPGAKYLDELQQWITDGGSFPHYFEDIPDVYDVPILVLVQITQYVAYLKQLGGENPHRRVLEAVAVGGIQGFCGGFLSAIAVAISEREENIAAFAAISLRIAVCIGAYSDQDSRFANPPSPTACLAIRWQKDDFNNQEVAKLIGSFPTAYISSINDETSISVTLRHSRLAEFTGELHNRGFLVKPVPVRGRYHCTEHSSAVDRLTKFSLVYSDLRFPSPKQLQVPLRSTATSEVITEGSLSRLAFENTLLKPCDWYRTLKTATLQLPHTQRLVASVGWANSFPTSLVQNSGVQVVSLSSLASNSPSGNVPDKKATINGTNGHKSTESSPPKVQTKDHPYPARSIAVVGMSGRFPGADDLSELWEILIAGKSMVQRVPADKVKLPETGEYEGTWWGNFLRDPSTFDHRFFKKSSREATSWDPQQRILLEVVYEALESAGYFGAKANKEPKDYGCYIGAVMNNYYDNVTCHPATAYSTLGTSRCFLNGCMSHYFGWTGPSLTIDTACSSSLVALNTACRAIWSGECSRAIAAGTNIITSPFDYQHLRAAGFLSPSGQCRPFDADADGYGRGEGVGVVVLKQLEDAIKDNDQIFGVIVGSATNQNQNFSHITVPYSGSQVNLYRNVVGMAGVDPKTVSYVEAHGPGTGVGDPVECRSIREVFGGQSREETLYFGSIKGNIGHTEATAGIAGVIKVLLMMQHGKIPVQASFEKLNPKIPDLAPDKMDIARAVMPWKPSSMALVNSYGASGSNAAVLIRGKPTTTAQVNGSKNGITQLSRYPLFISAASASSLSMYSQKLSTWLKHQNSKTASENLPRDLTFNLADRANHSLPYTVATTVTNLHDIEETLAAVASGRNILATDNQKSAILVFGGQESDFVGLSEEIYHSSSLFRHYLDECHDVLISLDLEGLYPAIFQQTQVTNLVTLHAALFSVQYASAQSWIDSGLEVSAVVGHSFGQLTALCVSGVLALPDAIKLVTGRASIMLKYWGRERGSMLFLQADRHLVSEIITSLNAQGGGFDAEIACYNGPKSHVVVGSEKTIDALEKHITNSSVVQDSLRTKRLNVTHGFHSKFTDALLPHITALAKELVWRLPKIHLEICDEAQSFAEPDFTLLANHTRRPVYFQQAVERLAQRFPQSTWLEAGRGSSVMQLVRGSVPEVEGSLFLSPQFTTSSTQDSLTETTISLWKAGHPVQFWPFHRKQRSQYEFLDLPPYQFEKTQHWLPFTGRRRGGEVEVIPEPKHEAPTTFDLLTFLGPKEGSKDVSLFRISPHNDRFKAMLGGHVMAGQSLAPASLYFEVVARAALLLQSDTKATTYVPTVEDFVMKSPIGLDATKDIVLSLKRIHDTLPSWSFSITTQAPPTSSGRVSTPFEHSTGLVQIKKRNDVKAAQEFGRFETLIGYRRYEEIMNHPEAEKMQGNHIYRAFNHIVHYGEIFRGIKTVACVGNEITGKVVIFPDANDPADQRLCDTPMTDSFMQLAGLLVNYFNNPSLEDVLVCSKIGHMEIGGNFSPDAKEWLVYSNMAKVGESDVSGDVYVFEAESKKLVMTGLGFRFSTMSQSMLGKMLKSVNKSAPSAKPVETITIQERDIPLAISSEKLSPPTKKVKQVKKSTLRPDLLKILHEVTDVPVEALKGNTSLEDHGVDSLMATEVLNDIRSNIGLTIDLTSFLFFPNLQAISTHIDSQLGSSDPEESADDIGNETPDTELETDDEPPKDVAQSLRETSIPAPQSDKFAGSSSVPSITSAYDSFHEIRFDYDELAVETNAANFWAEAYPPQRRLVLAYVVQAFAKIGCDLETLQKGDTVPTVQHLAKHQQLVQQFYRVIEDGGLISGSQEKYVRTDVPVDHTPAEALYQPLIDAYPQHAVVNKLVKVIGAELAECLTGEKDGLQLMFGDKNNKRTLEDMYANWPLLRTPTLLLGDFLLKAFNKSTGSGKFRILEIGAGTGGTTKYLVDYLRKNGIPFEYTFTDISASLVASAKKTFKGVEEMKYEVLDIEKPHPEHEGAFHVIIATNCIHATKKLEKSLLHIRQMLREDGALTLIEVTKNMFWLDIIVGLLEGWWLFDDGRVHALVDENHWARVMKKVGFKDVLWTDGDSPEASTVRVIAAFPTAPSVNGTQPGKKVTVGLETVVYKKIGNTDIHADVYYSNANLPAGKMPIALMIHGGSHCIFSRKDTRPAQTRLLLEKGFVPVSLDHRLCPEVPLAKGPMVDVCDALEWARYILPNIKLEQKKLKMDGERVVVVGWSSGGQLAMSLAWTAPSRGLRPPEAILAFYAPTDYEDDWWQHPIQPIGAGDKGEDYDLLEAIQEEPITNYGGVSAWEPLSDPRIQTDPRSRIVLHINWKAQTLPVIIGGLLSKKKAKASKVADWKALPQPPLSDIIEVSPRAQIIRGNYKTPTFLIHGTADDLVPWQQSHGTYGALVSHGVPTGLELIINAPHICDLSGDPESEGWKAVLKGYNFISSYV